MNTDDGRILPSDELKARADRMVEDLTRWVDITDDEARTLRKYPRARRGKTLQRLRGHLPPGR